MPKSLLPSVLPVLRNLPSDFPREPLLPGLKRRPLNIWPLLFLTALVFFFAYAYRQSSSLVAPSPERATTQGRVTQVERAGGTARDSSQQIFVKYRFMAGNQLVYGSQITGPQDGIPNVGEQIPVSYLPRDTSNNNREVATSVSGFDSFLNRFASTFIPLLFLVCFGFLFFLFSPTTPRDWLNWRRARGLYSKGELASGRVQFVRPASAFRSPNAVIRYEIVATYKVEGVRYVATTRCDNAWLVNQLVPETEVVIAHDPLRPERAVVLEPFAF